MNKRAAVFMYIVCLGFIIALFMFYGNTGKNSPGGSDLYLGEKEIELFNTYFEAEKDIYYIELSANLAAKEASSSNFQSEFETKFNKYLELLEQDVEFSIIYDFKTDSTIITGYAVDEMEYNKHNHVYKIKPDFKIEIEKSVSQSSSSFA